jgi:hypothetical protein
MAVGRPPGSFARMSQTGRVSSRFVDPVLAGLVALAVYCLHGFGNALDRDQATFVYGGVRFAHGIPPYRGVFNSVGPLGDMVSGLGTRIGWWWGLDSLTGARLIYLVLSAACVSGISVLAREALRSRAAGVLAPAVFLVFASFLKLATAGPREKTVMVLCLECALVLLLHRRHFIAGVLTALAVLTWQPVVLVAVAAALVAILTSGAPRRRSLAAFVLGGVVPTALMVAYFLSQGALKEAYWGFIRVNIGYTRQPNIVQSWSLLTGDYGWSLALVVAGWGAGIVAGGVALARYRRRNSLVEVDRHLLVLGTGGLVAGLWSCYQINGGPDLYVVLPFAGVGLAWGLLAVGERVGHPTALRLGAAVLALSVVVAGVEAVSTRDDGLTTQRRDVSRMVAAVPPGSTVLSLSAPEVLVLLHRRNPYPWQLSNSAISQFLDDHLDGGLAGYADRIARLHPTLIAIGHHTVDDWLEPVLDRDYTRVGGADRWVWYAANSLGRSALHRLRQVNRVAWTSH